jgi:hypothetical protein
MKTLEDVLEEIRPTPDPEFVADMERRMQLGFPRKRERRLLPVLRPRAFAAAAASAGLAAVVAVSLVGSDGNREDAPVQAVEEFSTDGAAEPAPRALDSTVDPAFVPPSGGGGGVAPGAGVRRIERNAQLTLASDPDGFDDIADAIFRTADRRNGFVLQSSFTQGEEGFSSGFFELRVPARELQPTLNELSRLATVRARSESGTDITGTFVSVRDRLRTAKALRTSLLRRLELAVTDTAVSALRRRLEIVGNRITGLRQELRGVRERTDYSTVFVELVDEDAGAVTGETDEALDDAVGSLEDVLNFLIRAAGIAVPLALAGFLAWLAVARSRRRARERSLA